MDLGWKLIFSRPEYSNTQRRRNNQRLWGAGQLILSLSPACLLPTAHHPAQGRAPPLYQVPLSLGLRLPVVPRLVPGRLALPHVLQDGVDECLAEKDAQVHDEEHIHRSETQDGRGDWVPAPPGTPSWLSNVRMSTLRAQTGTTQQRDPLTNCPSSKGKLVYICVHSGRWPVFGATGTELGAGNSGGQECRAWPPCSGGFCMV